jgi:hypothetical protein
MSKSLISNLGGRSMRCIGLWAFGCAVAMFSSWSTEVWAVTCPACVAPFCKYQTNAGDLEVGKKYILKSQCEVRDCGAEDEAECEATVSLESTKSFDLTGDLNSPEDIFGLSATWKTDTTEISSCKETVKCKPNQQRPAAYAYLAYNYVQKSQRWTSVARVFPFVNGPCDPCADNTKVGTLCKDPFTSCGGTLHTWEPALKTVADVCP